MLSALVNEELFIHRAAKAVLRKHTLHGYFYYLVRTTCNEALGRLGLLTARIAGIGHVFLVFHFVAGKDDFTAVDYYHIISAVKMRCVIRLVLATEYVSNLGSHAAKRLVGSVNYIPVAIHYFIVSRLCFKAEVSHDLFLKSAGGV